VADVDFPEQPMPDEVKVVRLTAERDQLRADVERLGNELEVERMRLAGCGVAAHGAGDEHFANMHPEYDSDALRATRAMYRQLRELREAAEALNQYITEQEDAEWISSSCLDVTHEAVKKFRAVLAKVGA
jgi:hypothetical protein